MFPSDINIMINYGNARKHIIWKSGPVKKDVLNTLGHLGEINPVAFYS